MSRRSLLTDLQPSGETRTTPDTLHRVNVRQNHPARQEWPTCRRRVRRCLNCDLNRQSGIRRVARWRANSRPDPRRLTDVPAVGALTRVCSLLVNTRPTIDDNTTEPTRHVR